MCLVPALTRLVVSRLGWLFAAGDERDAEILALRHQVLVLQRQVARPVFTDTDRTILAVLSTAFNRARLCDVFLIVQPATVIGWHRRLAIAMARENPTWGYRRIHGELTRLGHTVAPSSVRKILRDAGIDPIPNRTGPSWAQFIRTQARAVIATDFCCVNTATLRRLHVLFFIEIVRHEALLNPAVVKGHRLRSVAAGRLKLRAA